jgi:hypothetical protein
VCLAAPAVEIKKEIRMSVTPEQSAEALNGMFKFGQSLAAGFFDYLGKQNAAFQQVARPGAAAAAA